MNSPDAWAVVLHGIGNAGKSMLAAEILWQRLPHVRTAAWVASLPTRRRPLRRARRRDQDPRPPGAADLLVIDDLSHTVGDRGFLCLFNVLTARQEDDRATIVTLDETLLAFSRHHWDLASTLTRRTLPVPCVQTYAQRTRQKRSSSAQSEAPAL